MGVRFVRKIRSVIEKRAKFYLHIQISEDICGPALHTVCTNNPTTKNLTDVCSVAQLILMYIFSAFSLI